MSGFVSRQPNGKYCRFSTTVDRLTDINMSFDDYVNVVMQIQHLNEEYAKKVADEVLTYHLRPFDEVLNSFAADNISEKKMIEMLRKMCDPNGIYEENFEYEILESIEDEDEFNEVTLALIEKAREICKLENRHK